VGSTAEWWRRVETAFQAALDSPKAERAALLERLCGGDVGLLREVEGLLAADLEATGFLEPLGEAAPEHDLRASEAPPATRVGPYRILHRIGDGGMGSVYAASREDAAYEKRVAVKFLRPAFASPGLEQRFRVERQILANLDHPCIARLLDGGSTADGTPYLVMDHVEGLPIDEYCDEHRLGVPARLELFRKVCAAVQYAHANLVVHRDIKPSNILVGTDGEPKLLDFGIAKLLAPAPAPERREPTLAGPYAMTPEYASPEQIRGDPVTTAADVYSLGALLYKLLTGLLPYDLQDRPLPQILKAVCEQEPARPSLTTRSLDKALAEARGASPRGLSRLLAGDLDNVVLKALRKEPERRYASVEQLSEDVRRQLEGLPVMARKDTLGYRTGKFVRRHPVGVTLAGVAGVTLVAFAATLAVQSARLHRALSESEAVTRFLKETLGSANPYGGVGREVTLVEVLEHSAARIDASFPAQPEIAATVRATLGVTFRDLARYQQARPLLEQALEARRRVLPKAHPAVAESLIDLGELFGQTGQLEQAEALFREALGAERARFGPDTLEAASALGGLGGILRKQGDYDGALAVLREALDIRSRRLPRSDPRVAQGQRQLGAVLQEKGDYAAAQPLLRQALESARAALPDDSTEITLALRDYAVLLTAKGDFAAAETLFKEVVERQRQRLGDDHSIVAENLTNVARVVAERGALAEAARLQREALEIFDRRFGQESAYSARAGMNLGIMLTQLGELEPARAELERSLATSRKAWGPAHQHTAIVLENLGYLCVVEHDYERGEAYFREAWQIMRATVGEAHPESVNSLNSLAYTVWQRGRRREAVALFEQALSLYSRMPSANAFYVAVCQSDYGALLTELRRYDEAREMLTAAYRTLAATAGPQSVQTRDTADRLSALRRAWRNPLFDAQLDELLRR
jgi:serine/threonine-protein kinase